MAVTKIALTAKFSENQQKTKVMSLSVSGVLCVCSEAGLAPGATQKMLLYGANGGVDVMSSLKVAGV